MIKEEYVTAKAIGGLYDLTNDHVMRLIGNLEGLTREDEKYDDVWKEGLFSSSAYLNPLELLNQLSIMVELACHDPKFSDVESNTVTRYWLREFLLGSGNLSIENCHNRIATIAVNTLEGMSPIEKAQIATSSATVWMHLSDESERTIIRYLEKVMNLYRAHLMALKTK